MNEADWRILSISDKWICLAYTQQVKVPGRQTRWGKESTKVAITRIATGRLMDDSFHCFSSLPWMPKVLEGGGCRSSFGEDRERRDGGFCRIRQLTCVTEYNWQDRETRLNLARGAAQQKIFKTRTLDLFREHWGNRPTCRKADATARIRKMALAAMSW